MAKAARLYLIRGMVQGVGFRPCVARLARKLGLAGSVRNTGRGVEITLWGELEAVETFPNRLRAAAPPMALITDIVPEAANLSGEPEGFTISASRVDPFPSLMVPPDIATCETCLAELSDPEDRRFGYPFLNCTDCGPRYSIIESIPYDRARTSMKAFTLCPSCEAEYNNPENRRFHAQPNACPLCGPSLSARGPDGHTMDGDPLSLAREALNFGKIVALLGLGGVHLACDATSEVAVSLLRKRKNRPAKPLAVMCADLEAAAIAGMAEGLSRETLLSSSAPIVLMPMKDNNPLAPSVAPGQATIGLFLPYTPLHKLLFDGLETNYLVMTSGNRSDEPIISTSEEALRDLSGVADLFLLHNREIVHPVDDSVVKVMASGKPTMIRRARGYAPKPLPLPEGGPPLLAVGAELLNTCTVLDRGLAFVGPHVGDLKNLETEAGFKRTVLHLLELLKVTPQLLVHDLHPDYRSTIFAREMAKGGTPLLAVQHHEAHAAACMAENGRFYGEGLCLTLDGVGLGHDGTLWGGELLVGRPGTFRRLAHLVPVPLPGGDAAAKEPWRMASSWLEHTRPGGWAGLDLPMLRARRPGEVETLAAMMAKGVNSPLTSSCGRLFDCASALLGFTGSMLYTAQAPMELEALASKASPTKGPGRYPLADIAEKDGIFILDPAPLIEALLNDVLKGAEKGSSSSSFHEALAASWAACAEIGAEATGIGEVFLSGGCFQNALLTGMIEGLLTRRGLRVFTHTLVPPNDGGISFGQAAWAALSGKA